MSRREARATTRSSSRATLSRRSTASGSRTPRTSRGSSGRPRAATRWPSSSGEARAASSSPSRSLSFQRIEDGGRDRFVAAADLVAAGDHDRADPFGIEPAADLVLVPFAVNAEESRLGPDLLDLGDGRHGVLARPAAEPIAEVELELGRVAGA